MRSALYVANILFTSLLTVRIFQTICGVIVILKTNMIRFKVEIRYRDDTVRVVDCVEPPNPSGPFLLIYETFEKRTYIPQEAIHEFSVLDYWCSKEKSPINQNAKTKGPMSPMRRQVVRAPAKDKRDDVQPERPHGKNSKV